MDKLLPVCLSGTGPGVYFPNSLRVSDPEWMRIHHRELQGIFDLLVFLFVSRGFFDLYQVHVPGTNDDPGIYLQIRSPDSLP